MNKRTAFVFWLPMIYSFFFARRCRRRFEGFAGSSDRLGALSIRSMEDHTPPERRSISVSLTSRALA